MQISIRIFLAHPARKGSQERPETRWISSPIWPGAPLNVPLRARRKGRGRESGLLTAPVTRLQMLLCLCDDTQWTFV